MRLFSRGCGFCYVLGLCGSGLDSVLFWVFDVHGGSRPFFDNRVRGLVLGVFVVWGRILVALVVGGFHHFYGARDCAAFLYK